MMFKIDELNHVAVRVRDLERSVKFYTEIVGLTVMERPAFKFPGAWLRIAGGQSVHLITGATGTAADSGSRGNHFAIAVASMDEAEAHLRGKGVEFSGPQVRPDGALQIYFQDPDGHTIELCMARK